MNLFKEFRNPTDIYGAQRPLLILSYLSGITPFKLVGPTNNRRLEVTVMGFVNTFLHILIFGVCFILTLQRNESIIGYFFKTEISRIGDTLQLCTGLIALTITFICCLIRRYTIINVFHMMSRIDDRLKELGVETDYKTTLHYILLVLLVEALIYFTYLIGSVYLLKSFEVYPVIYVWVSFFLPCLIVSTIVAKFLCLVKQLRHRFLLLNKVLINLQTNQNNPFEKLSSSKNIERPYGISSVLSATPSKTNEEIIDSITSIHDELCDTCSMAENYFTVQMLTIVSIAFVIIVFNTYYVFEALFENVITGTSFGTTEFVIFFSYQIVMYSIAVVAVVSVSSSAMVESEKTSSYVHKLMNMTMQGVLKEKLMYFSLQLIHRKVKFTACGLFPLDRTLIFTIVGAATTYLVILLQFTISSSRTPPVSAHLNITMNSTIK